MALLAVFGPLKRPWRVFRRFLPPPNFITLHYAYFTGTCLLGAIIFWGSSTPARSVSFTDSLFLVTSAMTLAGLNTLNLSTLNTFQQFMLFCLAMMGSAIFISILVVHVRRRAFEQKFKDIYEERQKRKQRRRGRSLSIRRTFSISRTFSTSRKSEYDMAEVSPMDQPEEKRSSSDNTAEDVTEKEPDGLSLDGAGPSNEARDLTPPGRRGGPEMNGVSSKTGQLMESALVSDDDEEEPVRAAPRITFGQDTRFPPAKASPFQPRRRKSSFISLQGVGARPMASIHPADPALLQHRPSFARSEAPIDEKHDANRYIDTIGGWISRNSQFHGLTEKEREKLGGHEYRAVVFLSWLVPIYFIVWQLVGCLACAAWIAVNRPGSARTNGLNPWWTGAFIGVSAFNNSGMSLLDANMTAYQTGYYLLLTVSLLILAGNTCYPIFLRLIVWTMLKLIDRFCDSEDETWSARAATLRFLLDHPRRCYTNLFPSQHTWWLLFGVATLNGLDWAAFGILNINNQRLNSLLAPNIRVIDGLFQAFAVRSGGFYVVPLPTLRISLQVLYVVMMYISVYPVVITMRNSNVYEERSLGIYAEDPTESSDPKSDDSAPDEGKPGVLRRARTLASALTPFRAQTSTQESNSNFIRHQLRAQLAHDTWLIVLALFLITILEAGKFASDPATYSVFNYLFEVVSAYGCVGLSVGVPWDAYSFCGSWGTVSKLVLIAVMLRGRHRGLPVAIDKAVLLPMGEGEGDGWAEEDDGRIRLERTFSRGGGVV